jgi:formylglycine-generating enzyme required for sulfatase activity/nitrate/TMAO reductase-like tetraheme cytochrome c subunit
MSSNPEKKRARRKAIVLLGTGIVIGVVALLGAKTGVEATGTDKFCDEFCHVHPQATQTWIKSTHYTTKSGVVTHCVDCHLPGGGLEYYTEKARLGAKDIYGKLFKDVSKIDWISKRSLDSASTFTYDSACIRCHQILFSAKLSKKGVDGHLHYQRSKDKMLCINCHLHSGHYREIKAEEMVDSGEDDAYDPNAYPASVDGFKSYTETIPGTPVKFEMVAIPGGSFSMGSPESEPYREPDEGPVRTVTLSPFWIGRTEVRWREWEAFYAQRGVPGRESSEYNPDAAETGPTPPYGSPDQGWGRGARPAITMTHHAAMVYCEWLSSVTGKKFRLPTEAEWEYACRAGTTTPYFVAGDPSDFTARSWWNRLMGADTSPLGDHARYDATSRLRTHPPAAIKPNPWGLLNTIGNVREFCLDWYSVKTYAQYPSSGVTDPRGPEEGKERVIRGGSYKSDAVDLRSAARDFTRHDAWMVTDPQSPKSIWWYSDSTDVGFRVVREFEPAKQVDTAAKPASTSN